MSSLSNLRLCVMCFALILGMFFVSQAEAQLAEGFAKKSDIFYLDMSVEKASEYQQSQCRLDVIYPTDTKGFASIVWFHGGGLMGGKRYMPHIDPKLKIATIAVSYSLVPKGTYQDCIDDAAASVAWVVKHIAELGGDPAKVFVSGHSAGGYLAAMVGLDKSWLDKHGVDADSLAGVAPFSGQTVTHSRIRIIMGHKNKELWLNEYAPLHHIRGDAPPILLITGDRTKEIPGRTEENLLLQRMLLAKGHPDITMYELQGYNHGNMTHGGYPILGRWVSSHVKAMSEK